MIRPITDYYNYEVEPAPRVKFHRHKGPVRAARDHKLPCDICGKPIVEGELYIYDVYMTDEDDKPDDYKRHYNCDLELEFG